MTTLGLYFTDANGKTTYHRLEHLQIVRKDDGSCELGIRTTDDITMNFHMMVKEDIRYKPLPE